MAETSESGLQEGKRVKRLIRKTQKAIEAVETEHLFLSPVKSHKRKALTLPLSAKPTRLIVRIPLLDQRGAGLGWEERRKEGVLEGKENKGPSNCRQESRMSMRNEEREREERGKEGEKPQRCKLMWTSVPEDDINPNYCILNVENKELPSTNQTELERSVLNDTVRLVRRRTNYHRKLNHQEKVLLHDEDVRYELDMLLEVFRATIKQVEMWIKDMNCGSGKPMESYFSAVNIRCIENLYGDQGLEMVGMLQERPNAALPIVLARLRRKAEEVDSYRTGFNHL